MSVDRVGAALRRKLGPLPVWVWAIISGGILYWLRSKGYFGGGVDQGETLQPQQAPAGEPQDQTTLSPGESIYDPNSGTLSTAPGGDGGGNDQSDAIGALTDAIANGITVRVQPGKAQPPKQHKPKHPPKTHKPQKPHKRRVKPKHPHQPHQRPGGRAHHHDPKPGKTQHWQPAQHKQRPRGGALIRAVTGGRVTAKDKPPVARGDKAIRGRAVTAEGQRPTRQRPTVPLVGRSSQRQHPVSTHHKAGGHPVHESPPRPSSPPPRHHRTPHHRKTK